MANYIKLTLLKISNNTRDGALDDNDDDVDDDYDDDDDDASADDEDE